METFRLSNGVDMPLLGYGVFQVSADEMAQIATMNQHDTGTINFGDPQFVKYLIETYG